MNILLGELFGSLLLILLGNGAVANAYLSKSKGLGGGWIDVSAGWGFAVAVAVYASGWISGGHLNPAVTVGFIIAGKTPLADLPLYCIGQLIGAMLGQFLVWICYYPHWEVTESSFLKLISFCTKPAIRRLGMNFLTEVIATAVLLIGVLAIFDMHNGIQKGFGPYAVGIVIFAIGLSLGGPTGYAINPTRDLGPRIMHSLLPLSGKGDSDWGYAWVPIFGPLLGGALGAWIYQYFAQFPPL